MLATPFMTLLLSASLMKAPPPAQAVNEDQVFVTRAAKDGQAEVELATLAQKKAGSEQARALASELRADHDRANAELMAIADGRAWPSTPSLAMSCGRSRRSSRI
jgi:predicted outer membrane protein